ncbi:MAG: lysophospholipid acyltransferase family protein [Kiritimatiellaeota bacterium]|nr:lysophospholipid acyltransferase family protein [Kiritimatiellota bacterium]
MQRVPPWRAPLEMALVRLGLAVIPALPRRAVVGLARLLGAAAYGLARRERRVGLANLELAYGATRTAADMRTILRTSFFSFALMMLDLFWFARHRTARLARWVVLDPSMNTLFQPGAALGITAHLGNWELLGQAVAQRGYPLASVAAPLANPAVDRIFQRIRARDGQEMIPREGAVRHILRRLRAGYKIGLLLDQNTPPDEGGLFVPFFGVPAPMSSAGAALALRTGAALFFGFCVPERDGHYRAFSTAFFRPDPADGTDQPAALEQLMLRIAGVLEQAVRDHPGHWLWMYKRWKYVAPGFDRSRYPFYAKPLPEKDSTNGRS